MIIETENPVSFMFCRIGPFRRSDRKGIMKMDNIFLI